MQYEGYSIKDLEVLSGIKAHTIRIWEKRYNLLAPKRTETNIRYYNDEDLKRILNISLVVKSGYKISKVALWDEQTLKETVINVTEEQSSSNDYLDEFMYYMLTFDNERFLRLTEEVIDKLGVEKAFFNVFFSLFQRIGTYWQTGAVFPAQEHYVTNIFRQKVIAEIDRTGFVNRKGHSILFFLKEGELHEISLLFYSLQALKLGYNVVYLGQSVPFDDLLKIRANPDIKYVFTAFINAISGEELENYLIRLKEGFPQQKIFITGKQIMDNEPNLPRNVKTIKDLGEFTKYMD